MALKVPTIVIFDMDGTTVRHIDPTTLHMLEFADNLGHRIRSIFSWIFRRGAQGNPMQDWEEYNNLKKPQLLVRRALHKLFQPKEVAQIVEPCPGLTLVLNLLREHKIPMALASNSLGKGYGHEIIETFDLEQYFITTTFREDIQKSKPSPEGLLLTLKNMDIEPTENDVIWHIGDQHKDVKAALAAQELLPCAVVPIAYAPGAAIATIEAGLTPDHIIPSYFDIRDRLVKLIKKENKRAKAKA